MAALPTQRWKAETDAAGHPTQARGERTRQALLQAAFNEIHRNGYRAASLSDILAAADCTKGSLYHHFPDKHALALAAAEEFTTAYLEELWLQPLAETSDPLPVLRRILASHAEQPDRFDLTLGCPVNNLGQEMAGIDEDFRDLLSALIARWRQAIADALRRGQADGTVRNDVNADNTASLIVAMHQGTIGTAKSTQDIDVIRKCGAAFSDYLTFLSPPSSPNRPL